MHFVVFRCYLLIQRIIKNSVLKNKIIDSAYFEEYL